MEKETRERIALKRYQIISPVLAEPARAQNEYFRQQAEREHDFPRYGLRKVGISTMKRWLNEYRKRGFNALKPKGRSDGGRPRRLDEQRLKVIEIKCKAYPYYTAQKLYEELRDQGLLGDPPVHYNTLLRVVKTQGWLSVKQRTDVRKAFEVDNVNDLWICDFMHGPRPLPQPHRQSRPLCHHRRSLPYGGGPRLQRFRGDQRTDSRSQGGVPRPRNTQEAVCGQRPQFLF